jgi:molybdopterin-dependent oxidoreductase alpha subunit
MHAMSSQDRPSRKVKIAPYKGAAGGWGSMQGMARVIGDETPPPVELLRELVRQNKADGFACVSCAWPKPAEPHVAEFCENGAKATAWDLTSRRCTPAFFAQHTLSELTGWSDYDLEQSGRLTEPVRYDPASDKYVPCAWADAFAEIGRELKGLRPTEVTFYASGRASLETAYMYGLLARMYGSQNLPDSSNMCHESTSVGLKQSIGSPVGAVQLEDFAKADAIFFFGQNVGTNSPRMLHDLQDAAKRGAPIVVFNPLKERALERFVNPQDPFQMLTGRATPIATQYLQVKAGGDLAAMTGLCKHVIEKDDAARVANQPEVLDHAFIGLHASGFETFAAFCRAADWDDIERQSGLARADLESAAETYAKAKSVIAVYGMGLTQHHLGVENVHMLCNLLMLRGNIGRLGAGPCPVRGHSNVQGQRTVGITEKPELAPLDRLKELYGFEPPRQKGMATVEICEALLKDGMTGFIGLGGNFLRAIPDGVRVEPHWRRQRLTVHIATKLNHTHVVPGEVCYLLPCLSRIERDEQATGAQTVSVEDSSSGVHASFGDKKPASPHLMSEPAIVAAMAQATLAPNPKVPWAEWTGDYAMVRDAIEATYPQWFEAFNARFSQPGGFQRPNKAAERDFSDAPGGKANFLPPSSLNATGFAEADGVFRLMTLRSNDQFNTTVYGYQDRFRGVTGTRAVLFINEGDMRRLGLAEGQEVGLATVYDDGIERSMAGLRVTPYSIPEGCLGTYYPECNVLMPVGHHANESLTPAAKSVPVRIVAG